MQVFSSPLCKSLFKICYRYYHNFDCFPLFYLNRTKAVNFRQNIILAGCANGTVEIWDVVTGNSLGVYNRSPVGVTYIQLRGSRLIVARLNGTLDFVELRFSQSADQMVRLCSACNEGAQFPLTPNFVSSPSPEIHRLTHPCPRLGSQPPGDKVATELSVLKHRV